MDTRCGHRGALLGIVLALSGCGEKAIDWAGPENLLVRETSADRDDGLQLDYWSLIDLPCKPIYDALVDVEHYPEFIPNVDRSQIVAQSEGSKTILIAQRVISRQSSAKVEWKFDPAKPQIDFKTLTSDFAFNDGTYTFEPSPDGKRCVVHTTFVVKQGEGQGQSVPLSVLAQATRSSFVEAAKGVKKRASGAAKPAG